MLDWLDSEIEAPRRLVLHVTDSECPRCGCERTAGDTLDDGEQLCNDCWIELNPRERRFGGFHVPSLTEYLLEYYENTTDTESGECLLTRFDCIELRDFTQVYGWVGYEYHPGEIVQPETKARLLVRFYLLSLLRTDNRLAAIENPCPHNPEFGIPADLLEEWRPPRYKRVTKREKQYDEVMRLFAEFQRLSLVRTAAIVNRPILPNAEYRQSLDMLKWKERQAQRDFERANRVLMSMKERKKSNK